jgi:hypothetical protein
VAYNPVVEHTDSEFLAAFENCSLASFHHRDHIRMALLYVERYGLEEGTRRAVEGIQHFAAHAGQSQKYHHTMTLAWMRLAAQLLDKNALDAYYSVDLLRSTQAREGWVEPDLNPLP